MSFFTQQIRPLNKSLIKDIQIGPGSYQSNIFHENNNYKNYVPFLSKSQKKYSIVNSSNIPGPGSYDYKTDIFQPLMHAYQHNQNLIIKIKTLGTSEFNSKQIRFLKNNNKRPGPGTYHTIINSNNKKEQQKRIQRKSIQSQKEKRRQYYKRLNNNKIKNRPSIPKKGQNLILHQSSEKNKLQIKKKIFQRNHKNKYKFVQKQKGYDWSKNDIKRFTEYNETQIGPGSYNIKDEIHKKNNNNSLSHSCFISNSTRSFFDNILFQTNNSNIAKQRLQNQYKSNQPSPATYNIENKLLKKKIKNNNQIYQFFGSTCNRFEQNYYQNGNKLEFINLCQDIGRNKSFNKKTNLYCNSDNNNKFKPILISEQNFIGPGSYNIEKKYQYNKNKISHFGSRQKRQYQKNKQQSYIGPGYYYKYNNENNNNKNNNNNIQSISFKSKTKRWKTQINSIQNSPTKYDVSYNDISKKLDRNLTYLNNLKKINAKIPIFMSNSQRFQHYQNKKKTGKNIEQIYYQKKQDKRNQTIRKNHIQTQGPQNSFSRAQRFQVYKKGTPGVGQYSIRSNWAKKCYNTKCNTQI